MKVAILLCFAVVLLSFVNGTSEENFRRKNRTKPCINDAGKQFKLGDRHWINDCQECVCTKFGFLCPSFHCDNSECVDFEFKKEKCCPVCPNGPNCGVRIEGDGDDLKIIAVGETRLINGKNCTCIEDEGSYVWHKYKSSCK